MNIFKKTIQRQYPSMTFSWLLEISPLSKSFLKQNLRWKEWTPLLIRISRIETSSKQKKILKTSPLFQYQQNFLLLPPLRQATTIYLQSSYSSLHSILFTSTIIVSTSFSFNFFGSITNGEAIWSGLILSQIACFSSNFKL